MKTNKNEIIVFTAGCFDILHAGHKFFLKEARKLGTSLIVAINEDSDIKKRKGPGRPINDWMNRMEDLYETNLVDLVHVFNGDDGLLLLIKKIRPDIIVTGDDYTEDSIIGAKERKEWGGRVQIIKNSRPNNISTTKIISGEMDRDGNLNNS